ncbi:immunity protein TriTu family protein [Brevibacillus agri]|uniref:immunity protein TriTu family protein n=1 Tax=Brevibacillus agri TaxID=51101 RepID=UPI0010094CA0|nr:hypothetical protein [Brevibacillus agri]MDT7986083.1 hypothetical protein [Clostridium perfringens]MBG9567982.1 hypothetical protein [Brevibacillus agri]MDR9507696.1 hypothetical protein [Brevibacillus agri]MED3501899.1 hypothetical protein [Brevibacillus agri]QAV14865.1 hypothetical protein BA6348_20080 [Brevibacillus agri]
MLDNFQIWAREIKGWLQAKGVETEEINIVDSTISDNPSITVHHYSPEKFIGLITLWETNTAYVEILEYSSGETVISEHLQIQANSDFNEVFKSYLSTISK